MSERIPTFLVQDMFEAVERILTYTAGLTYEEFLLDHKTADAVIRNLQVLGEAANRVPAHVRDQSPEIEWVRIIRSRHIIVHDYFGIDFQIIWRIVTVHLPTLKELLSNLLAYLNDTTGDSTTNSNS